MSRKINIGILGLGNISTNHMKSIKELNRCNLVAVASQNAGKRKDAENQYGVKGYKKLEDLLSHPGLDVVIVCTPSGTHLEQTIEIAKAGKHVIVEKPLEVTLDRTREMLKVCNEHHVTLSCIFQNRFSDDYQKMLKAIQDGELGKLILGNAYIKWFRSQEYYDSAQWRGTISGDGGAALINQSIHTIDLLLHIMGKVKSVSGQVKTLTHDIEGEDIGIGMLEFENGALGTIEGSTSIFEGFPEKLEIHGSDGSIILEGGKIVHWKTKKSGTLTFSQIETKSGSSNPADIGFLHHKKQLDAIVQAILNGNSPPVSPEEAILPIQVIESIYTSSRTGKRINLV